MTDEWTDSGSSAIEKKTTIGNNSVVIKLIDRSFEG